MEHSKTQKLSSQNPDLKVWSFLTFGAGKLPIRRSAHRLGSSATKSNFFNSVYVENQYTLQKNHQEFWAIHEKFIRANPRGFGLWIWKPYLILYYLNNLEWDQGLLYLDSGCHLNLSNELSQKRLINYFQTAQNTKSLATQTFDGAFGYPDLSEKTWSRKRVTDYFELTDEQLNSGQIQAGIVFLIKTPQNIQLVQEWYESCLRDNYELLKDGFEETNSPGFREHRHDQSIFSALSKKFQITAIPDETYWHPNWKTDGSCFPIWAMRNKSGINPDGPLASDLFDRFYNFLENFYPAIWVRKIIRKIYK